MQSEARQVSGSQSSVSAAKGTTPDALDVGTAVTLPLDELDSNPFQPRSVMDERALKELTDSIRSQGLLVPIAVRRVVAPGGGQRYQVIAGHRRLEAFRRLRDESGDRWERIPAHWRQGVDDETMAAFALSENLQRDDLQPLDSALSLHRFQIQYALTTEEVASRMGLDVEKVKRLLRLARAPKVIQEACRVGVMVGATGGDDAARRERVHLELMAALEFARLHTHFAKQAPKKADERTERAIERALGERWTFRRIQQHCRAVLGCRGPATSEPHSSNDVLTPLYVDDGDELRIARSRIQAATLSERDGLIKLLAVVVKALSGAASGQHDRSVDAPVP